MLALLARAALAAVLGAGHSGRVAGDVVDWESTLVVDRVGDAVALAVPLPPGTVVQGAEPVWGDGGVVALRLPLVTRARVRVTDPLGDGLHPPVPAGDALQRVTLRGSGFTPDPALALERRVRYTAPAGLSGHDRRALGRMLGDRTHARDRAVYLTGARVTQAGGLRGELVDARSGLLGATSVALLLFGAAVAAMFALYRALARMERVEAAEAYIEREFARRTASVADDADSG